MSVSMDSKVRNDLYNIMSDLYYIMSDPKSKTVCPGGDSGVLLKIIETSGKEISGCVVDYNEERVKINFHVNDGAELDKETSIPIHNIKSLSLLEETHPLVFAFKYLDRSNYYPIVHIEEKDGRTWTGELAHIAKSKSEKISFRVFLEKNNAGWFCGVPTIESTNPSGFFPTPLT